MSALGVISALCNLQYSVSTTTPLVTGIPAFSHGEINVVNMCLEQSCFCCCSFLTVTAFSKQYSNIQINVVILLGFSTFSFSLPHLVPLYEFVAFIFEAVLQDSDASV